MLSLGLYDLFKQKNIMSDYPFPMQNKNQIQMQLWWITACLISINVALFAWQVLQGMDITQPNTIDALRWGADYAPLTFLAEPIRLFSSMFFHFGLIHLMLNMWALYIFGNIAEQLFGRVYFIALYVLAGLMGSLLSGYMTIQDSYELIRVAEPVRGLYPGVGAGASGAVMGLGAALTMLSVLPRLKHQMFILDKKTLLTVLAINLAMGFMISGINNAAHIGGMIMGAALALIWYFGQKFHQASLMQTLGILFAIVACYLFYQYCLELIIPIHDLWKEFANQILTQMRS